MIDFTGGCWLCIYINTAAQPPQWTVACLRLVRRQQLIERMVGPSASLLLAALAAASVLTVNFTAHVHADIDEITPSEWVRLHNAYRQTMYDDVKVPPVS